MSQTERLERTAFGSIVCMYSLWAPEDSASEMAFTRLYELTETELTKEQIIIELQKQRDQFPKSEKSYSTLNAAISLTRTVLDEAPYFAQLFDAESQQSVLIQIDREDVLAWYGWLAGEPKPEVPIRYSRDIWHEKEQLEVRERKFGE